MIPEVLLAYHPKNEAESTQLEHALKEPLHQAGVALSRRATDARSGSLPPQSHRRVRVVIAMIGSNGSVPTINPATFSKNTLIVPTLIQGSLDVDIKISAAIKQRSVLTFEVSLSDGASLARLTSAIPQLVRPVGGLNHSLPEAIANSLFESTIRFYEENAESFIHMHEEEIPKAQMSEIFSFVSQVERRRRLTERARILDAGCGPGHHARFFAKCGFTAIGIDCCSRFIQHATAVSKGDCSFVEGDMQKLDSYFSEEYRFEGIWANASCLHLPRGAVARVLDQFRRYLRPNGVLGVSFQLGMSTLQREGRFFERYEANEPGEMLRQHGFAVIETLEGQATKSTTGRKRIKQWLSLVAVPVAS